MFWRFRKDGSFSQYECICAADCWEIWVVLVTNVVYIKFRRVRFFFFQKINHVYLMPMPLLLWMQHISLLINWHPIPERYGLKAFLTGQEFVCLQTLRQNWQWGHFECLSTINSFRGESHFSRQCILQFHLIFWVSAGQCVSFKNKSP